MDNKQQQFKQQRSIQSSCGQAVDVDVDVVFNQFLHLGATLMCPRPDRQADVDQCRWGAANISGRNDNFDTQKTLLLVHKLNASEGNGHFLSWYVCSSWP
jgi:hypothetical protein